MEEVERINLVSDWSTIYLTSDPFEIVEAVGLDTLSIRPSDPPYTPTSVTVGPLTSDTLALRVAYGGGCAEHRFRLYGSAEFADNHRHPVQNYLMLVHNDGGDTCEALISEELRFDLTPLKAQYRKIYQEQSGVILMQLHDGDSGELIVRYEF